MRVSRVYFVVGLMIAFFMFFEIAAHAGTFSEETRISFSAPVQIPGQVLPAGTYIFELADPENNQNLVRIYNADHSVLYGTLATLPAARTEPTGNTTVTLAEPESGTPIVLRWFYPETTAGHEFIYPQQQQQAIEQATEATFTGGVETAGQ